MSALPLKAVGVQKFEQVVFNAVKEEVRAGVLGLIEKEREGEEVDREGGRGRVMIVVELGCVVGREHLRCGHLHVHHTPLLLPWPPPCHSQCQPKRQRRNWGSGRGTP